VGGHLRRTGVAGREARAARVEERVLDAAADEALVAGQLGLGQHFLHRPFSFASVPPRLPGPAMPPEARTRASSSLWRFIARSTLSGESMSDWSSISPSRQSSNSSCSANFNERIVGASVIRLVPFKWYV